MIRLFTAGGVILDTVVAADGTLGPRSMGGNAVYSAAGARLWLDGVGIVGRLPANYPRDLVAQLEASGVDTQGLRVEAESVTEGEWFFYRPDGSRADHLHAPLDEPPPHPPGTRLDARTCCLLEERLRSRPAEGRDFASFRRSHPVRLEDVPAAYRQARAAHLAANRPDQQVEVARGLSREGIGVSVDPGSNAGLYPAADLAELFRASRAFLPSEKELEALAPGLGLAAGLLHVQRLGAPIMVVKLGARGCGWLRPDGALDTMPAFPVAAVDPTGAGDAFCGGFLAGLVLFEDVRAAICLGTISASFAVEAFGPFHLLGTPRHIARARLDSYLASLDPCVAEPLRPILSDLDAA
ncbi:carbohydrate kinase family protein [Ancylobacter sp. SL191]|uniref:carbohydrate kinase family protein n=1 Tax=Ancylobacter sp. SL191 TaxID=2995166 RepID=UPI00226E323E|nr:carbohydrate kinase family protein [Ancylobacter sp. SL191]WAC26092.1 carbohydrate kinase family protein [Ancylobacter sp. SL191]